MPSKIIGYARVSTEDQDLSLQKAALEKFGVDGIITEHASGKSVDRRQLKALLKVSRPGDTVVVWKLDRLGRNLTGVLGVIEDFERRDINLVSITDGFDARTPMGRAMMQISLVFAELERNLISERTKAGMAAAKAEGKVFGRKPLITGFPKRMEYLRALDAAGQLRDADNVLLMTPRAICEGLNAADKKAPAIINVETVRRWRRDGFPGLDQGDETEGQS